MLSGTMPSSQAPAAPPRSHKVAQPAQKANKRERSAERFQPPYAPTNNTSQALPPPASMTTPPVVSLPDLAATHIAKSAKAGGATPSLSSILAAYKKDGNGDRALLVALLEAKRREDERLAARDVLAAEQLRAQNLHYAFYLASQYPPQFTQPQFPHPGPQHPHQPPSSHGGSSPRSRSGSVVSSAAASTYTAASRKRQRFGDEPVTREEAMHALRGKIARSTEGSRSPPCPAVVQHEADELDEDEDEDESELEPLTPPRAPATLGEKRKAPQGKNFAMLLNAVDQERRGLQMTMGSR